MNISVSVINLSATCVSRSIGTSIEGIWRLELLLSEYPFAFWMLFDLSCGFVSREVKQRTYGHNPELAIPSLALMLPSKGLLHLRNAVIPSLHAIYVVCLGTS